MTTKAKPVFVVRERVRLDTGRRQRGTGNWVYRWSRWWTIARVPRLVDALALIDAHRHHPSDMRHVERMVLHRGEKIAGYYS